MVRVPLQGNLLPLVYRQGQPCSEIVFLEDCIQIAPPVSPRWQHPMVSPVPPAPASRYAEL